MADCECAVRKSPLMASRFLADFHALRWLSSLSRHRTLVRRITARPPQIPSQTPSPPQHRRAKAACSVYGSDFDKLNPPPSG